MSINVAEHKRGGAIVVDPEAVEGPRAPREAKGIR
jgi:hypothetical protein